MARQQTLKQAFIAVGTPMQTFTAVGRKIEAPTMTPTRTMRQTKLNFHGGPTRYAQDSDDDTAENTEDSVDTCDCGDHTAHMKDDYICICTQEGCDYYSDPETCACRYCWEWGLYEDPLLWAVRPGAFYEHKESSWVYSGRWDDLEELYDSGSSAHELKHFVLERGLKDPYPNGITLKYYYLKELLEADQKRVFRFLNLPPELRNEVYEYLLTSSLPDERYPEILGTCNAIYDEAFEILHSPGGATTCTFLSAKYDESLSINGKYHREATNFCSFELPTAMHICPRFLSRIRNLKINISIDLPEAQLSSFEDGDFRFLQTSVLALASKVMEGRRLKTLEFVVNTEDSFDDDKVISSMLFPVRRLRNIDARIWASVPEEVEDDAIAEMRLTDPACNTVKHCLSILANAEVYLCLVEFLDPLPSHQIPRTGNSRAAQIAQDVDHLRRQMSCGRPLFRDWPGEVDVQGRLVNIQTHLYEVFPTHIAQQFEYLQGKMTYRHGKVLFALWVDKDEVHDYLDQLKNHLHKAFPDEMWNIVASFSKVTSDGMADQATNDRRWIMDDPARAKSPWPVRKRI